MATWPTARHALPVAACIAALTALATAGCLLPQAGLVYASGDARHAEPIGRLGRWDGTRFVEVTPGSLPPSHLRVLVHGWSPGLSRRRAIDERLRAWELADDDPRFEPWLERMARIFSERDPYAVIVAYSWVDDSATVRAPLAERRALGFTELHGQLLAEALDAALAPEFEAENGQIQLLGHSYGARVAAVCAVERAAEGRPVAQVTLFDAPDAALPRLSGSQTELERVLRRLPIGWGRGRTFVDNYVAMVGRRYAVLLEHDDVGRRSSPPRMVDVQLAPPAGSFAFRVRHLFPMAFYERSPGTGVGYDWSPLVAQSPPTSGCWEQRAYDADALVHGCTGL